MITVLGLRERFVKDERGFTLAEMMVTIMIMVIVFLALFSIFDMSLKVFSFGNNKVEAAESARVGLEKMERELRQAYRYDPVNDQDYLFWDSGSPSMAAFPDSNSVVTFGNDFNGNGRIDVATEQITYALSGTTLERNGQPIVESVQDVDEPPDGTALAFKYLDANGEAITSGDEADIAMVGVGLEVSVNQGTSTEGTQILTTVIDLRNRE